MSRRGTVLIVVAGLAAVTIAVLAAVVARMRGDAEENRLVWRDAQARLMLVAACHYVQETARLGWDDPATPEHEEACGWIDVRDGAPGPKRLGPLVGGPWDDHPRDRDGGRLYRRGSAAWPDVGGVARCPMDPWTRPRWAIRPLAAPNAIATTATTADFPYLTRPDPLPAIDDEDAFAAGDPRPRPEAAGRAWFRVLRVAPARFLLTCGSGASRGLRDWAEAVATGEAAAFIDEEGFREAQRLETRHHWLIEWSASCGDNYSNLSNSGPDHYRWQPMNSEQGDQELGQPLDRNLVGTIRWIQRLAEAPAEW